MEINGKGIKRALARGIVVATLTGTIMSSNPKTFSDVTYVQAASSLESTKKSDLKKLEKVYKNYNKKYYSASEYTKLTNYYNKGVNAIKECKDKETLKTTYTKYVNALKAITPSVLVKYQKKVEKSFLKTYKKLVKENEYSSYNLQELETIKTEGINKIYATKNKTNAKKAKTTYINKLKAVQTILDETKEQAIEYIISNDNLPTNVKQAIIENIYSLNSVENVKAIAKEYGYKESEYVTVTQVENLIKQLKKQYPKYTEEEIRCLAATANMDFVKSEDIYTIFNVKSKEELEKQGELLDTLMEEMYDNMAIECIHLSRPNMQFDLYDEYKKRYRRYDDMIQIDDLFIKEDMKKQASYVYTEMNYMVKYPSAGNNGLETTNGTIAAKELAKYVINNEKGKDTAYIYTDLKLTDTGSGYIINKTACKAFAECADARTKFGVIENDEWDAFLDKLQGFKNPITEYIKNNKYKIKK